ncbi:MAG: class I SAM-dependent methyltransferase [Actinomycetota bacterium]
MADSFPRVAWVCPVCGGRTAEDRFRIHGAATEAGVDPRAFRPTSDLYGTTTARVVRCLACGHGSLAQAPPADATATAYAEAADSVSLREEGGQIETACRALALVERHVRPGHVCDLGCWTGSFLVAARRRGWEPVGIEPSMWAVARARERGLDVRATDLAHHGLEPGRFRLVALCDILEHLVDPGAALDIAAELLHPDGCVYLTVPDAGSVTARLMGRRWWSVLPMHVQYFTRASIVRLLGDHGFRVLHLGTHAKVFSTRYYSERLGGYSKTLAGASAAVLERAGRAGRLVAPDFHDRLAIVAAPVRSRSPAPPPGR